MPITLNGTTGASFPDGSAGTPAEKGSTSSTAGIFYPAANTVAISTNSTEALRVDSSQNVGIGTSSPGVKLDVSGAINSTISGKSAQLNAAGGSIYASFADGTNTWRVGAGIFGAGLFSIFNSTNSTFAITLDATGKLTAPAVYNNTAGSANVSVDANGLLTRITSSIKYKKDVVTYNDGLNKVLGLRPVTYKSKCELDENTLYGGFIAEEVAETGLEEFIERNSDGDVEAVRYPNMVALMAAAIQELSAKLDAAEARIAALEAK